MAVKSYENIKKQPYLKKHPYIKKYMAFYSHRFLTLFIIC